METNSLKDVKKNLKKKKSLPTDPNFSGQKIVNKQFNFLGPIFTVIKPFFGSWLAI